MIGPERLYKVLAPDEWSELQKFGEFLGNREDLGHGLIHLLTEDELAAALEDTAAHGQVVVALHRYSLGEALQWTATTGYTLSRPLVLGNVASHGAGGVARRRRLQNDFHIAEVIGKGWFWLSLGFSSVAFVAGLVTAASDALLVAPALFLGAFITGTLSWTLLWWTAALHLFPSLGEADESSMKRRTIVAYVIICLVSVLLVRMY